MAANSFGDILEPASHEPSVLVEAEAEAGTQIAAIEDTPSSAEELAVQFQHLDERVLPRASGQQQQISRAEKTGVVESAAAEPVAVAEAVAVASTVARVTLALDGVALHQPGTKVDSATCLVK